MKYYISRTIEQINNKMKDVRLQWAFKTLEIEVRVTRKKIKILLLSFFDI